MKLAEIYGIPTRRLQRELSGRDYTELVAYYTLYPHWTDAICYYLAQIAQEIQHTRACWTNEKPKELDDYIFDFTGEQADGMQSQADMERVAKLIASQYG